MKALKELTLILAFFFIFWEVGDAQRAWDMNGIPLCDEEGNQGDLGKPTAAVRVPAPESSIFDSHIVCVWHDERNNNGDIFAQRFDEHGRRQWPHPQDPEDFNGVPVCTADGHQSLPRIIACHDDDGQELTGEVIIAWQDLRDGVDDADVYSQ